MRITPLWCPDIPGLAPFSSSADRRTSCADPPTGPVAIGAGLRPGPPRAPLGRAPRGRPAPPRRRHAGGSAVAAPHRDVPGPARPAGPGWSWCATAPPNGAGRAPHRPHRPAAARRGPTRGRGARAAPGRPRLHARAHEPAAPGPRDLRDRRVRAPRPRCATDLREWDYGDYEGRTTDDIRAAAPGVVVVGATACPTARAPADVGARADRVVSRGSRRRAGDVLAFAHGARPARAGGPVGGADGRGRGAVHAGAGHDQRAGLGTRRCRSMTRWNDAAG